MTQATRPDGSKRWHVFVGEPRPRKHDGGNRKTVWTRTANEARKSAESLGYVVERVEPAPPARWE